MNEASDTEELTPKYRAGFIHKIEKLSPYDEGLDTQGRMANPSEFVTDLLTDIRHYCDSKNVDFAACDRTAYDHYLNEREHGKENSNG